MEDQITLGGFEAPDEQEQAYIRKHYNRFTEAVIAAGGTEAMLSVKATAADKSGNGYTVLSVANLTAFRLRMRKGKQFVAIPTTFEDIVPEDMKIEKLSSDQKYFRLSIDADTPIDTYTELLVKITKATLDRYPTEWGCCSRYEACSDASSCIHPDKEFALKCAYRKNLNAGRIFYGKNKTN